MEFIAYIYILLQISKYIEIINNSFVLNFLPY